MGSALFVVLDRELAGVDTGMNGKALARNERRLTALAESLGVRDLWSFYGEDPAELAAVLEIDDEPAGDLDDLDDPDELDRRWFAPAEGLEVVRALRRGIEADLKAVDNPAAVIEDLADIERILTAAAERRARWSLAVDF